MPRLCLVVRADHDGTSVPADPESTSLAQLLQTVPSFSIRRLLKPTALLQMELGPQGCASGVLSLVAVDSVSTHCTLTVLTKGSLVSSLPLWVCRLLCSLLHMLHIW